tara:strand:+ start:11603 stop:12538 length:936 start_codon:yes stop_codon:yes gene_type:complete
MALRDLDRRAAFCLTKLANLVLLAAVPGIGLAIVGCGGSSEAPPASSEVADDSASTDADMSDAAMMSSSDMSDPSMNSSMDVSSMESSMLETAVTHETSSEFADTSLGHGEGEPGSEAEMLATGTTSTEPGDTDTAMSAQIAAAEAAANPSSTLPSDPGTDAAMSAQMAAANNQPGIGSESGEIGQEGTDAGPDGENGGGAQEPPADSPDYPAFKVVMGLMQGNHEGLKDFIATTGRGLTEKIRSGSLTAEEKDDLKKTFVQPQLVGAPRTIRGSRTVILNSGGQVITLVSKKQGTSWKVSSISIKAASKR